MTDVCLLCLILAISCAVRHSYKFNVPRCIVQIVPNFVVQTKEHIFLLQMSRVNHWRAAEEDQTLVGWHSDAGHRGRFCDGSPVSRQGEHEKRLQQTQEGSVAHCFVFLWTRELKEKFATEKSKQWDDSPSA